MSKENKIATTVKIPSELYDEFKVLGIRHKISLQTLVEKCVNLFVTSDPFRDQINGYKIPKASSLENAESSEPVRIVITGSCAS
jgi:hypothetical protein